MICGDNRGNLIKKIADVFEGKSCLPANEIRIVKNVRSVIHAMGKFPGGINTKLKRKLNDLEKS